MHFLGVRRSAREASHYFPRLRREVDGGKGLKQSTIEAKIRRAYKMGIPQSLLVRHEAVFDRTRQLKGEGEGVVKHYLIENPDRTLFLEPFLDETASGVIRLMDENPNAKAEYIVTVWFRSNKAEDPEKEFKKHPRSLQVDTAPKGENARVYFEKVKKGVLKSYEDLKWEESDLTISYVEYGEVTFSKTNNSGKAGHFVPLPKHLRIKNAIINIQNKDKYCLMWAVTRAVNFEGANNVRVTPFLREKAEQLDWSGINFPVALSCEDIVNFERNNKIGIAIYARSEEDGEYSIYRHRCPQEKFKKIVNLFAMKLPNGKEYDYHFCVIRRLTALLQRCDGREKKVVCCSYCPARFYNKIGAVLEKGIKPKKGVVKTADELRLEHEEVCQQLTGERIAPQEKLPKPGENILEFRKWDHLFPNTMFAVADYESALVDHYEVRGENVICTQKHVTVAFSLKFVSDIPGLQFERIDYRGPKAAKRFVRELRQVAGKIQEKFPSYGLPAKRTKEEEEMFDKERKCFACGGEFVYGDKKMGKVFDHDHYTGNYRSAMHNVCNRQCRDNRTFPIFFHNFSGYDSHFLIRELNAIDDGEISALPRNEEKFISIRKSFHTANRTDNWGNPCKRFVHFEFKDSYSFMNSSLDTLSKNLEEEDFEPYAKLTGRIGSYLRASRYFPIGF